jgi:hypothetical protein
VFGNPGKTLALVYEILHHPPSWLVFEKNYLFGSHDPYDVDGRVESKQQYIFV